MPDIAPLRAVRYSRRVSLEKCISPPYDVISPEQRAAYAARDPHNVVRLILPEAGGGGDQYAEAAKTYRRWLVEGALERDAEDTLYVLRQTFNWGGKRYIRRGLMARLRLQPFSDGVVLPHERTLSGPKADRLQLFRAVRANLSPIFALYPEEGRNAQDLAEQAMGARPELSARGDDGVDNALFAVRAPLFMQEIRAALHARKAFIADGHHRYETGLAYAAEIERERGEISADRGHRFILCFLCSLRDPGLLILPTHRLLHSLAGFRLTALLERAQEAFTVERVGAVESAVHFQARLAEAGGASPSFLLLAKEGTFLLTLRAGLDVGQFPELPQSPVLRGLDVAILHSLLLQRALGLSTESQERQENLRYVKEVPAAVDAVRAGTAQAAFALNPTRIEQVQAVAEAGEVMPQKSTFFYPKLPSGLMFSPLDPEERVE